ncbi:MAG: hypothetical protein IKN72_06400 [Clostridia bacterium]|nr:hypothetical protein [Clostridia bacterium]
MAKNYLTYPFAVMRITQRYDGETSHKPHMTGDPKEWALDEGEKDTGRGWVLCPCDEMKVAKLTGVGTKGTNALYLTSTTKCDLANGKQSIATVQLVHPNDDDLKKLHAGQTFKRGEKICREGNDGATGYHIHMAVGLGTIVGTGWQKNSKGKWVLVTTGGPIKPEDAFWIDPAVTTVMNAAGLKFKTVPAQKPAPGKYRVTVNVLNVRTGTSTRLSVRAVLGKGSTVEITKVKTGLDGEVWGKVDGKGWVRMEYLEAVK